MKSTTYPIIRANGSHVDALQQLSVTTFVHTFAASNTEEDMRLYLEESMQTHQLAAELADDQNLFYMVTIDQEYVAYGKAKIIENPKDLEGHKAMEIERLYVLAAYKQKGIGSFLLHFYTQLAKQAQCTMLFLGVWEHNAPAIAFYEAAGFTAYSSHIFKLGTDLQTDILMKKVIV